MWTLQRSRERINRSLAGCATITVKDLTSDIDLSNLSLTTAYRVDAAHVYVDVVDAHELLDTVATESERSHRRYLRFLHLYQRAAHLVFDRTDAMKVDFQNQRLHFIVFRPFGEAASRVHAAVAIGKLFVELVEQASELHQDLPDVSVAVGIESGACLAVRNGHRGDREPLFIGNAANQAAKLLFGKPGVYLGREARKQLGEDWRTDDLKVKLSSAQLGRCARAADLSVSVEPLLDKWKDELSRTPQATFTFHRPTPPLAGLELPTLTPANAARIDAVSIKADIDGFTKFVSDAVDTRRGEGAAVRILHAARSEMRDVISDFGGRKVRYLGDCVEGVLAVGERITRDQQTVLAAVACAGALREAFDFLRAQEPAASVLGLAIGIDYGPVSVCALGVRNSRVVCSAGLAVLDAQQVQESCNGRQTALGATAASHLPSEVKALFGPDGKATELTTAKVGYAAKQAGWALREIGLHEASSVPLQYPRAYLRTAR